MRGDRWALAMLAALLVAAPLTASAAAAPEAATSPCSASSTSPGDAGDAVPPALREGTRLGYDELRRVAPLLPAEVWRLREVFFHRGMALEIGGCQLHYPTGPLEPEPGAQAKPPDLDGQAPREDAGLRWAWSLELRDRATGLSGPFRLVDIPSRLGGIQRYEGEWSYYVLPEAGTGSGDSAHYFVASGRFHSPNWVRHLAWRQLRSRAALQDAETRDDILVYLPALRKVRRAVAGWVDGLYMPRYRGGADAGSVAGIAGAAGVQLTEHLAQGWLGLSLRPGAYRWRLLEEKAVLAPLNVRHAGYPTDPQRHYGPSGLSLGDDRWDVRRAVVIQGALRRRERNYDFLTLYIDVETRHPLYLLRHRRGARLVDVGILAHRHAIASPPGRGARIGALAPVAAVFHRSDGSGWRRESYRLELGKPDAAELERVLSGDALARGR